LLSVTLRVVGGSAEEFLQRQFWIFLESFVESFILELADPLFSRKRVSKPFY
jgi:hypothetical protein